MAFGHLLPHQTVRCVAFKPLEKAFCASLDSLVIIVVLGFDDEQAKLSYLENLETNCQQGFHLDSLLKQQRGRHALQRIGRKRKNPCGSLEQR
jgi:hypothetical protein